MAKSTALNLPQHIRTKGVQFVNADGTTAKTLYTVGAEDARLLSLTVVSDDTAAVNIQILLGIGGTDYPIGTVNVPIASGSNGTVNGIDLINATAIPGLPVDANGKRYLPLEAGVVLKVKPLVAVTAAKTVSIVASLEDYA